MGGPEFFRTMMGKMFYEGSVPKLIKALERIATAAEKYVGPAPAAKPQPRSRCISPVFVPDTLGEEMSAGRWLPCEKCPECQILIVAKKALNELQELNKPYYRDGEWGIVKELKKAIKDVEKRR